MGCALLTGTSDVKANSAHKCGSCPCRSCSTHFTHPQEHHLLGARAVKSTPTRALLLLLLLVHGSGFAWTPGVTVTNSGNTLTADTKRQQRCHRGATHAHRDALKVKCGQKNHAHHADSQGASLLPFLLLVLLLLLLQATKNGVDLWVTSSLAHNTSTARWQPHTAFCLPFLYQTRHNTRHHSERSTSVLRLLPPARDMSAS